MKIKIFCDSADLKTIKKFIANPLVSGFTTNPSLMKIAGAKNYKNYSFKLLSVCKKKPISFEVFADSHDQMLEQAEIINSWGKTWNDINFSYFVLSLNTGIKITCIIFC